MRKSNRLLLKLIAAILLFVIYADAAEPKLHLRWNLNNEGEFFREVVLENPATPRLFKLDGEKANREGAEACGQEAKAGKPKRDFCKALAARLAPVFSFAFDSADPGTFVLDHIDIECFRILHHREGMGFVRDNASYDLLLPNRVGVVRRAPPRVLIFSSSGTIQLRVWPDWDVNESGGSLDLEIRFIFMSNNKSYAVSSGRFILAL